MSKSRGARLLVAVLIAISLSAGPTSVGVAEGDVEQRIAEFWKRVDALQPGDFLSAADLGQWALNVIERNPRARITVIDFRSSTSGMQGGMERAGLAPVAPAPTPPPKTGNVEQRIAEFWKRVDALQPGDFLSAADLGQWALNVIERNPRSRIIVTDFRSSTSGMQDGMERAGLAPVGAAPTPTPTPAPSLVVRSVETRPGVRVSYLLARPVGAPRGGLVLFPGADGRFAFGEVFGQLLLGPHLMARVTSDLAAQGFVVALVDVPSDQPSGMTEAFRRSGEHAADVRKVIDALAAEGARSIHLVGISGGAISVVGLGMVLDDPRVAGLVMGATPLGVSGYELSRIRLPVLLLHHRDDACPGSPFAESVRTRERLTSAKVTFVEAWGGSAVAETPNSLQLIAQQVLRLPPECVHPAAHSFSGVEDLVVRTIVDWIGGREVPTTIGR